MNLEDGNGDPKGRQTDVFLPHGSDSVGDAVCRANAYLRAGADYAVDIGVEDRDMISHPRAGIDGPLNVLAGPGSPTVAERAAVDSAASALNPAFTERRRARRARQPSTPRAREYAL